MDMSKRKAKKQAPKNRSMPALGMILRTGNHAGKHKNKPMRGSGKGSGKVARAPKHKGRRDW
tara:strand:+ start:2307 stop:2492 length:186 start_codon:yes stop_codon:yes gene_type:complete